MYIPPGFAEVTYKWQAVAGYRESMSSCGFSIASWDEDVAALAALWDDFIPAIGWPSTGFSTGVIVKVGTSDPSAPITFEAGSPTPGSGSSTPSSNQVSMLATKRTLLGGRKGRGRMFLPAPLESQVNNTGELDSSYKGNVQDSLDDIINGTAGMLNGEPYLLHTASSPAPTLIQAVTVESIVATQRRRLKRS